MATHQPLTLIPADEARRIMLETPPVGTEVVPLRAAGGRVLAEPLAAPEDLPPAARAVMDGYAVRAADVAAASPTSPARLRLGGAVAMGGIFAGQVAPGEAVGISTGGFLPGGADAVVMVEHTDAAQPGTADAVAIRGAVAPGANVIQRGEDLAAGAPVLARGRRLRPQDLAALATFGVTAVKVHRRPRIAVLSTGNEICEASAAPAPGQVRDANQIVIGIDVAEAGGECTYGGIVPDDPEALRAAIERLLPDHDGVILSGGSSVGAKDISGVVLRGLAPPGVLFHGIHIRPGKPTIFARVGDKPVLGMPGFPTSSMVVFDGFVRPLLWRMGGEAVGPGGDGNHRGRDPWPCARRARLARAYMSPAGREDYLRVRLSLRDGETWADVLPGGSSAISNVIFADGLVRVEAARERVAEGEWVDVRVF
jgi:molybdopterin molybdotransferase